MSDKADKELVEKCLLTVSEANYDNMIDILKAQLTKAIPIIRKAVAEWGIEPCLEHSTGGVLTRRECPICWRTLGNPTGKRGG